MKYMILCVYSHKNRTRVGSDHNVDNPVLSWAKSIGSNHIGYLLILPTLWTPGPGLNWIGARGSTVDRPELAAAQPKVNQSRFGYW